jgi:hypothetical protein
MNTGMQGEVVSEKSLKKELEKHKKSLRWVKVKCVAFGIVITIGVVAYYVAYQNYTGLTRFFQ